MRDSRYIRLPRVQQIRPASVAPDDRSARPRGPDGDGSDHRPGTGWVTAVLRSSIWPEGADELQIKTANRKPIRYASR